MYRYLPSVIRVVRRRFLLILPLITFFVLALSREQGNSHLRMLWAKRSPPLQCTPVETLLLHLSRLYLSLNSTILTIHLSSHLLRQLRSDLIQLWLLLTLLRQSLLHVR